MGDDDNSDGQNPTSGDIITISTAIEGSDPAKRPTAKETTGGASPKSPWTKRNQIEEHLPSID